MKLFLRISITAITLVASAAIIVSLETTKAAAQTTSKRLQPEMKNLLETADEFTLLSLNPDRDYFNQSTNTFLQYVILGKIDIKTGTERNGLVEALDKAIANGNAAADCFNQRHGIHVRKGTKTLDCLICFECGEACVGTNWHVISSDPKTLFNQTLQKAGVPLPKN
jgi:hypothetical protein